MFIGLLAALVASVVYGISSVMQAHGARRAASVHLPDASGPRAATGGPSMKSTAAAVVTISFVVGSGLDLVGFGAGAVAARMIPLFLSQAVTSASLIVTALLGTAVLKIRMRRREWLAIVTVIASLAAVAIASGRRGASYEPHQTHWVVFATGAIVFVAGHLIVRRLGSRGAVAAGLSAGLLFGAVAVAVRIVNGVAPLQVSVLLADPAAWTIVLAGVGGLYLYTVGLQLGSVNGAAAALIVGETVVPGVVGVLWFGDSTRTGLGWLAVAGFVIAVMGAVAAAMMGASRAVPACDVSSEQADRTPIPLHSP